MRTVSGDDIARVLTYAGLVEALRDAFRSDIVVPVRHHYALPQPSADGTLLVMPAWTASPGFVGCKIVTVCPDNLAVDVPSVQGTYLLMSGTTGEPLAVMDGGTLTAWRTGAASALAASYLARSDASHLLMVGAGALGIHLVRAHAAVRPVRRVTLWNRTRARAGRLAAALAPDGFAVSVTDDLEAAVREADVISCATLSTVPLIQGAWLARGAHVDLVGGFAPHMREADDMAIMRSRLYVDTRDGVREAGDIASPLARGIIGDADIRGDLFDLCRGTTEGRTSADEITLFKSAGTAIEDLAAAMLAWTRLGAP